jgi:hypothetical protein
MPESQRVLLWALVVAHATAHGRPVSVADVCAVAVSAAQASGAWVTAASSRGPDFVMSVAGPASEQLAEVQLTLGEGPCQDVLAAAAPVLASDLGDEDAVRRWPGFTTEARRLGAGAVFAFPLMIGAIRAGVLGLYRDSPGPLAGPALGDCLLLGDVATVLLVDGLGRGADGLGRGADGQENGNVAGPAGQPPALALHRAEVDQATGMLTVQLGVTVTEAYARLRAYAYAEDRRLADVAGDIVARRLRLHPDPAPEAEP